MPYNKMPYSGDWSWRGASGSGCVEKGLRSGSEGGKISCAGSHPQGLQSDATVPRGFRCSIHSLCAVPLVPDECPQHSSCWPGAPRDYL